LRAQCRHKTGKQRGQWWGSLYSVIYRKRRTDRWLEEEEDDGLAWQCSWNKDT